jgi:hypothetical protein
MRNALSYEPGTLNMSNTVTDGSAGGMAYKDADVNAKVNINYGKLQCATCFLMHLLVSMYSCAVQLGITGCTEGAKLLHMATPAGAGSKKADNSLLDDPYAAGCHCHATAMSVAGSQHSVYRQFDCGS